MDETANLKVEYLRNRRVCAAGRLASMSRAELARLVESCGGQFLRRPRRTGFIFVMGDEGLSSGDRGTLSQHVAAARRIRARGYPVDFTTEEEFLERLGLHGSASAIRGPHTLSDLSRILRTPTVRLRRWLRAGLLRPVAERHSLPYFDFHQVSFINHLRDALERGASLAVIQRGIEQCRGMLPHQESLDDVWSNIERDGRVLLRLKEQLIDQSGQRYFDFESQGDYDSTVCAPAIEGNLHDLCDQALALEEDGRYSEALRTYERALQLSPDNPTLHFDCGNVLFQLGREEAAIAEFERATEMDCDFAMAWHNLGSVRAHQGHWPGAESALRRALQLVPTYADSHFTLAEVLRKQGRLLEASRHEQEYHSNSNADALLRGRDFRLRLVHETVDAEGCRQPRTKLGGSVARPVWNETAPKRI